MRLLDARALIYDNVARLKDFPDADNAPPYAILSHTWEHEEVLFQDIALGPQHEVPDEDEVEDEFEGEGGESSASTHSDFSKRTESTSSFESDYEVPDEDEGKSSDDGSSLDNDFEDVESTTSTTSSEIGYHIKAGWNKVLNTSFLTVRDGMRFVWIDTCCIDKSSSAELSEAINSMFGWYKRARCCYAHLNDCHRPPDESWKVVPEKAKVLIEWDVEDFWRDDCLCACNSQTDASETSPKNDSMLNLLQDCRWFFRGWTLQELIAPEQLWFFDRNWRFLVHRDEILTEIEEITGIHKAVFWRDYFTHNRTLELSYFSVAQRMHWASSRRTTRKEDEAYCLLGIFNINMPLLYGEGSQAFKRLQEEILKTTSDHSILAWEWPGHRRRDGSLLAVSPSYFRGAARYIAPFRRNPPRSNADNPQQDMYLTRRGLQIELSVDEYLLQYRGATQVAVLECVYDEPGGHSHAVGLLLQTEYRDPQPWQSMQFHTFVTKIESGLRSTVESPVRDRRLIKLPLSLIRNRTAKKPLLISNLPCEPSLYPLGTLICMEFPLSGPRPSEDWQVSATYPRSQWSETEGTLELPDTTDSYGGLVISHREHGTMFVIFGFGPRQSRHDERGRKWAVQRKHYFWIVKDIQIDAKTQERPFRGLIPNMPHPFPREREYCKIVRLEYCLERLCKRASTFVRRDYFESSIRRQNSHKSVWSQGRLVAGTLAVSAFTGVFSFDLRTEAGDVKDEEDFFRLEDICKEYRWS